MRREIITGEKEPPEDALVEEEEEEETQKEKDGDNEEGEEAQEDAPAGIPDFWRIAIANHPYFEQLVRNIQGLHFY